MAKDTAEPIQLTDEQIALAEAPSFEALKPDPAVDETPSEEEVDESTSEESDEQPEPEEAEAPQAEEAQDEPAEQAEEPWVTDAIERRAAAYGLTRDDLEQFESKEEFGRFTRLADRMQASREPEPKVEEEKAEESDEPLKARDKDGKLNLEYYKSQYEDDDVPELVKEVATLRETIDQFQQQQQASVAQQQLNSFHDALDKHAEFYGASLQDGRPAEVSQEEADRRQRVYEAAQLVYEQGQKSGQTFSDWDSLIEVAHRVAFPNEQLGVDPEAEQRAAEEKARQAEEAQKERTEKIKKQSRRRRPVSTSRSTPMQGRETKEMSAEEIARLPEVAKFFRDPAPV